MCACEGLKMTRNCLEVQGKAISKKGQFQPICKFMKLTFWGGLQGHLPKCRVLKPPLPSQTIQFDICHFASSISCLEY